MCNPSYQLPSPRPGRSSQFGACPSREVGPVPVGDGAWPLALVVEDDAALLDLECEILEGGGFRVAPMLTLPDVDAVRQLRPDLLILDLVIGSDLTAGNLIAELRATPDLRSVPVMVCTGHVRLATHERDTLQSMVQAILYKPFNIEALVDVARNCVVNARGMAHTGAASCDVGRDG